MIRFNIFLPLDKIKIFDLIILPQLLKLSKKMKHLFSFCLVFDEEVFRQR